MTTTSFDNTAQVSVIYPCKPCTAKLRASTGKKRVMVAKKVTYSRRVQGIRSGAFGSQVTGVQTWTLGGEIVERSALALSRNPPSRCCDKCGSRNQGAVVKGRHNDDIKCGARCCNAVGGDCDCSCGGANHGSCY